MTARGGTEITRRFSQGVEKRQSVLRPVRGLRKTARVALAMRQWEREPPFIEAIFEDSLSNLYFRSGSE